jgi:chromate transporter
VGINSATYVGYTVTGNVFGSLLATFAVVLPSFILVLTICHLYMKFKESNLFASLMKTLRPIVIGMIAAAAGILVTKENFFDWTSWVLFAGAFAACQWLKTNPIWVIIAGGVIGLIIY